MIDATMRYGMLIVAVVIITILIALAMRTSVNIEAESEFQSISAGSREVSMLLTRLCSGCLAKADTDSDCVLVEVALTKGNITGESFAPQIIYEGPALLSTGVLKVSSRSGSCVVRNLG